MVGKLVGTAGVFVLSASMVSAATIPVNGAYFDWSATGKGLTIGAGVDQWSSMGGSSTPPGTGTGSWTLGTLSGQTAAILTDDTNYKFVQAVKDLPGTGGTLPTAADFDYYVQFDYYVSSSSPRSGGGTLVYRERTATKETLTLQLNATTLTMSVNGKQLKTDASTSYLLPLDTWVTFTVHRLNNTDYTVTVNDGSDKELGWISGSSFTLTHLATVGTTDPVVRYQLGTGMAWNDNLQMGYRFFKVGEAVPEPASMSLLGAGASLLLMRRR